MTQYDPIKYTQDENETANENSSKKTEEVEAVSSQSSSSQRIESKCSPRTDEEPDIFSASKNMLLSQEAETILPNTAEDENIVCSMSLKQTEDYKSPQKISTAKLKGIENSLPTQTPEKNLLGRVIDETAVHTKSSITEPPNSTDDDSDTEAEHSTFIKTPKHPPHLTKDIIWNDHSKHRHNSLNFNLSAETSDEDVFEEDMTEQDFLELMDNLYYNYPDKPCPSFFESLKHIPENRSSTPRIHPAKLVVNKCLKPDSIRKFTFTTNNQIEDFEAKLKPNTDRKIEKPAKSLKQSSQKAKPNQKRKAKSSLRVLSKRKKNTTDLGSCNNYHKLAGMKKIKIIRMYMKLEANNRNLESANRKAKKSIVNEKQKTRNLLLLLNDHKLKVEGNLNATQTSDEIQFTPKKTEKPEQKTNTSLSNITVKEWAEQAYSKLPLERSAKVKRNKVLQDKEINQKGNVERTPTEKNLTSTPE